MSKSDLPLVRAWLEAPHVARWWPDGDKQARSINEHLGEPSMRCLILTIDDADVGYLQVYDPHHEPCIAPDGTIGHPYRDQPPGTRGIDLFVGEPKHVGCGHGPRLVAHVVTGLFDQGGCPCVVTDPDPSNSQSIAAFRKAGFFPIEERDTGWGHVLLMRCDNPDQATSP